MSRSVQNLYGIQLLDDLHNYFPEILYAPSHFETTHELLLYIRTQATHINPYEIGLENYRQTTAAVNTIHSPQRSISPRGRHQPTNYEIPMLVPPSTSSRGRRQTTNHEIPTLVPPSTSPRGRHQSTNDEIPMLVPSTSGTASASASAFNAFTASTASTASRSYMPNIYETYDVHIQSPTGLIPNTRSVDNAVLQAILGLIHLGEGAEEAEGVGAGAGAGGLEPVIVRPTRQTIDLRTTQSIAQVSNQAETCIICQETYTEGQTIRSITYCTHKFHKNCIDRWLDTNVHCPICRHDIREQ